MILGNPNKIDLSISSFKNMRTNNNLYVDKTKFIENFLRESNSVQLIVRPRRLGKSLNMDTLSRFLSDKDDNRSLFAGTYIERSQVWETAHSAPVFMFDFKNLNPKDYKLQIFDQIDKHISSYINPNDLEGYHKRRFERLMNHPENNTEGILILTELIYGLTGKRSYILIDEYDKLLIDNYNSENYEEIKRYETQLLSAGLKGNEYLEKALLTGVMRISRESVVSDLNNLVTYDVFSDKVYINDFGLTNEEIDQLHDYYDFNKNQVREWYNGIKINGASIYNIYAVLSCAQNGAFANYWGRSGTLDIILKQLNGNRMEQLEKLLSGQHIDVMVDWRISLNDLAGHASDSTFYSLLVQAGYLAIDSRLSENTLSRLYIPNTELMNVWKNFILNNYTKEETQVRTLFDNIHNLNVFDMDIEYFLSDRLSYYDIADNPNESFKTKERIYHVFVLGLLSAYEDISYKKPPISNRESGDGRYDILFERKNFSIIFEFKSVEHENQLKTAAEDGLKQIDEKRYFVGAPADKLLIKTAIAFWGKKCMVRSSRHE